MIEVWKEIKNYEGLYLISNFGRIKSLYVFRILKPGKDKDKYFQILLYKNKKNQMFKVHRLVAIHFIDNALNKPEVNHKNGNKSDNHVVNLDWMTTGENHKHAYNIGLKKANKKSVNIGEKNKMAKLTKREVLEIKNLKNKMNIKQISILFNVSYNCIYRILNNKAWKNIKGVEL